MPDTRATPGDTYRWSRLPTAATRPPQAIGQGLLQAGFVNVHVWPPGTVPGDWPETDLDPARMRFQGTLPVGAQEVDLPPDIRLWSWAYPGEPRRSS